MKYRMVSDFHTHTVYSHGLGTIEENVITARAKGLKEIGISDHGPGHLFYGIKRSDVPIMRAEIEALQEKYPDIKIYLSVEANIINSNGRLDVRPQEFTEYDYVVAGYHYGVAGRNVPRSLFNHAENLLESKFDIATRRLMRYNTRLVVKALENNDIKILAHPGDKAPVDLLEIAVACARTNTLMELNTWHMSMNAEDIKTAALTDTKFVISSDAHSPDRVADFESAIDLALDAGISMDRIVNIEAIA